MSKKTGNVIALEIEKYKAKINEFQTYLEKNKIEGMTFVKDQDKHKEFDTQIKLMNALPTWLQALKELETNSAEKPTELRGGAELNDIARLKMDRNKE